MPIRTQSIPYLGAFAWANRPTSAPVGATARFTDLGLGSAGRMMVWNGTYWAPFGGRMVFAAAGATLASPLSTVTGVTSGQFTTPGATIALPAGFLQPGWILNVRSHMRRRGANGTASFNVRLGTNGTVGSDNAGWGFSMSATNNQDVRGLTEMSIASSTSFMTPNWTIVQGAQTGAALDRTTGFNIASVNYVTFDVLSANTADAFDLVYYGVDVTGV